MGNIAAQDVRAVFTKTLIDVYQERTTPTGFLRAMFDVTTAPTKSVSIQVERMGEWLAIDMERGTDGQRVTFSQSTEKVFVPPFYRLSFDATNEDLYDRVLGSQGDANAPLFAALLNRVADRIGTLQDMIDRATELQCAQVIQTGKVTLKTGDSLDYRRKATSFVTLTGAFWDATGDPFAQIAAGCAFLRTVGKSPDTIFRAICGESALAALLTNAKFLARQNYFNMALDAVAAPIRNSVGAAYHGTLTCGAYRVELWTYPQSYDTLATDGTLTPNKYIDDKTVTLVPSNPRFKLAYAAVPQLVGQPGDLPKQGKYVLGEWIDMRKATHEFDIASAPLAIPVAVDQMYTMKVLA